MADDADIYSNGAEICNVGLIFLKIEISISWVPPLEFGLVGDDCWEQNLDIVNALLIEFNFW